jgi:hypothetical protein
LHYFPAYSFPYFAYCFAYCRILFDIFSIFLVVISIDFVIPSLSKNLKNYDKSVEIFKSSRVNIFEKGKGFSVVKDSELIITMQNGREWTFSPEYSDYWKKIGDSSNVGKKFVIYTQGLFDSNPSQVEVENKIIYNLSTKNQSKYLILFLTLISVTYSIISYRKHNKQKTEMEVKKPAGNSG